MQSNTFDLFIFDFDGTLADSRKSIFNSFENARKATGLPSVSMELFYPTIGRLNIQETFLHFYPSLSPQDVETLTKAYREHLLTRGKRDILLFPTVRETLSVLSKKGKKLAILTTKNIKIIEQILQDLDLAKYFAVVWGEGCTVAKKPERACIEHIWTVLGKVSPEKTVMVGDTLVDVQTAANAGISMIGVGYGIDGEEKLKSYGSTYIIKQFSDITQFT